MRHGTGRDTGACWLESIEVSYIPLPLHFRLLEKVHVFLPKAIENGIPITDPAFYSSTTRCPDSVIEKVFEVSPECSEPLPLVQERIAILREVGSTLCHVRLIASSRDTCGHH